MSCEKLEKLKFSILTFGCRCNQAESDAIRKSLCRRSMIEIENRRDADLAVINTCTVTQRSDQQVRQAIRRLHRENPSARIIVTGCYAERDPSALADMPGVSLVVGNGVKERLGEILENGEESGSGKIVRAPLDSDGDYLLPPTGNTGGKTRPLVKIQDGCDAHCSYCVVPSVRGPGRSARLEDVLAEIQSLAKFAHEREMFLHMDGARISNAVAAQGMTLRQATRDLGVDVLSFGGTKNGLMGVEAVVFFRPELACEFLFTRKQGMQLASKMRFMSVQMEALLTNDLWRRNAEHALEVELGVVDVLGIGSAEVAACIARVFDNDGIGNTSLAQPALQHGAHAVAPAAGRFQIGNNFRFVHSIWFGHTMPQTALLAKPQF